MRRSGVTLCSMDGIRRSDWQSETSIALWGNTSTCLAAVSVTIVGTLVRCCDHEAEWQESSGQWHFVGPSAKCADL